jgi:fumarate hydratase, class II
MFGWSPALTETSGFQSNPNGGEDMSTPEFRTERDSMGEVRVPRAAYYGAQTQRAVENFPISGIGFPPRFIRALAIIKHAAASANQELGLLDAKIAEAIRHRRKAG